MNEYDEYEEEEALPDIEEDWVKDLSRLDELKAQKAQIEDEIAHINEKAAEAGLYGQFVDTDGVVHKVKVRVDPLPPKVVKFDLLAAENPRLAAEISSPAVDSKKLKEAIKKGYFANTNASKYLVTGTKKPWVQVSTLAKEDASNE